MNKVSIFKPYIRQNVFQANHSSAKYNSPLDNINLKLLFQCRLSKMANNGGVGRGWEQGYTCKVKKLYLPMKFIHLTSKRKSNA